MLWSAYFGIYLLGHALDSGPNLTVPASVYAAGSRGEPIRSLFGEPGNPHLASVRVL